MKADVPDFEQIYADFRPRIHRYLTSMVGELEAEDLAQEVFVKLSQALDTFRGEAKLSTWIYRIATNAALDRMRSPSFRRDVQADAARLGFLLQAFPQRAVGRHAPADAENPLSGLLQRR